MKQGFYLIIVALFSVLGGCSESQPPAPAPSPPAPLLDKPVLVWSLPEKQRPDWTSVCKAKTVHCAVEGSQNENEIKAGDRAKEKARNKIVQRAGTMIELLSKYQEYLRAKSGDIQNPEVERTQKERLKAKGYFEGIEETSRYTEFWKNESGTESYFKVWVKVEISKNEMQAAKKWAKDIKIQNAKRFRDKLSRGIERADSLARENSILAALKAYKETLKLSDEMNSPPSSDSTLNPKEAEKYLQEARRLKSDIRTEETLLVNRIHFEASPEEYNVCLNESITLKAKLFLSTNETKKKIFNFPFWRVIALNKNLNKIEGIIKKNRETEDSTGNYSPQQLREKISEAGGWYSNNLSAPQMTRSFKKRGRARVYFAIDTEEIRGAVSDDVLGILKSKEVEFWINVECSLMQDLPETLKDLDPTEDYESKCKGNWKVEVEYKLWPPSVDLFERCR